ncbi:RsmD family RNA methyltransferase [Nonomuraea indica]|uniref:RsmD family RNA methyltransferase n=1 Tax=Nonomuraea indica TaxID=1581193 RepID=A0ABW8AC23_9ACTN|nr:RsmD family RNA methyltransferase [Nonomuraea indica]
MTRIIAGVAGGRRLVVPPGRGTRPTSDRAREGIFLTLDSLYGLAGARVMDLYAGSGAVGLEALSRGAAHALLVESDPKAVRTIRANARSLGLEGAQVVADKVERLLARGPGGDRPHSPPGAEGMADEGRSGGDGGPYDIVFADPPYAVPEEEVVRVLESLRDHGWLVDGGLVAFERETRGKALMWPEGYVEERVRRYGEASVWYGRAAGNP